MSNFKAAFDVTPINNIFIEKYMPKAKAAIFSVIYIYALKHAYAGSELTNGNIADALNILESDVIKAWQYWAEQGIIKLTNTDGVYCVEFLKLSEEAKPIDNTQKDMSPIKPTYTVNDINQIYSTQPSIKQLINAVEKVYAKPFSAADLSTVIGFSQWLGLPDEVILVLFNYCKSKPMRYIETIACDWAKKGVNSTENAESYINSYNYYYKILSFLGISNREPLEGEISIMDTWLNDFKMPIEVIKVACNRAAMHTSNRPISYANGILTKWHSNNIKTIAQIEADDLLFKKSNSSEKGKPTVQAKQPAIKPTKFVNYNQPTYSAEEINAAIERKKQRTNK